jgi:hypothetical protein
VVADAGDVDFVLSLAGRFSRRAIPVEIELEVWRFLVGVRQPRLHLLAWTMALSPEVDESVATIQKGRYRAALKLVVGHRPPMRGVDREHFAPQMAVVPSSFDRARSPS